MTTYALNECHEEVQDENEDRAEPCNKPAVGWRIDPGEGQPYPACVTHHRWPYADQWVQALAERDRLEQQLHRVKSIVDGLGDTEDSVDALALWEDLDRALAGVG